MVRVRGATTSQGQMYPCPLRRRCRDGVRGCARRTHYLERGSPMRNRKREIRTSGSARDEDEQPPHLLGRRQFLHLAAGAAALTAVSRIAEAQAYPSRPVHLIVGFPASGLTDILARLLGPSLSEGLGQQFIVEDRPGAGTNLATEAVVRALPDGYTLLMAT